MILAELGPDMSRFASDRRAASWAAICPGHDESAGKRRSGKTRKGNPHLRAALIEAANAIAQTKNTYLRAQYEQVKRRRGHKKAIGALAHSILIAAYHGLSRDHVDGVSRPLVSVSLHLSALLADPAPWRRTVPTSSRAACRPTPHLRRQCCPPASPDRYGGRGRGLLPTRSYGASWRSAGLDEERSSRLRSSRGRARRSRFVQTITAPRSVATFALSGPAFAGSIDLG